MKKLGNLMTPWNPKWPRLKNLKAKMGDNQILFCLTWKYYFRVFSTKFEIRLYSQQFNVNLFQGWRPPLLNCYYPILIRNSSVVVFQCFIHGWVVVRVPVAFVCSRVSAWCGRSWSPGCLKEKQRKTKQNR